MFELRAESLFLLGKSLEVGVLGWCSLNSEVRTLSSSGAQVAFSAQGGSLSQKLCVSVRSDLYSSAAITTLPRQIAACVVVCLRPH